jgi:hypothetical protein
MPRWGSTAPSLSDSARTDELEQLELSEVPAAVICAACGDPECAGCLPDETTRPSGVVAVIPWERPNLGFRERLWSTARLCTLSCEAFFGALPTGDVLPALRFAISCELVAALGLSITLIPLALALAPAIVPLALHDPATRHVLLNLVLYGVPGLAITMVAIHAAHGIGLDLAARHLGSRRSSATGVRFGLYACGWDLVTLPLGIALVCIGDGFSAAGRAIVLALQAPSRASQAYLRQVHQLDPERAARAARLAALASIAVLFAGLLATAVALAATSF